MYSLSVFPLNVDLALFGILLITFQNYLETTKTENTLQCIVIIYKTILLDKILFPSELKINYLKLSY